MNIDANIYICYYVLAPDAPIEFRGKQTKIERKTEDKGVT